MQYNFNFSESDILIFALVLLRSSAFLVSWPVLGSSLVPRNVKIFLALIITIVIYPSVTRFYNPASVMSEELIMLALREVMVGVLLGFVCRMFFFAISIAGQITSMSMGLQSAQIMNPSLGTRSGVIEQFQVAMASLLFLSVNGHHLFLSGMVESFSVVSVVTNSVDVSLFRLFGVFFQEIIVIGIKMASPVMIAILFMNIAMGIIGKAVPQINVLITSLPANILMGLFVLIISLPMFINEMDYLINLMTERFYQVMKGI